MEIDIQGLEKQRYDAIKKTGKYLEFNVLIGTEDEDIGEGVGRTPVITTDLHGCGSEEISFLYATLQNMLVSLSKQYPVECFMAQIGMEGYAMGFTQHPIDVDEEE